MNKTLVIIESPGKRKKLEAILGSNFIVKPSYGHIRDLPQKQMGVEAPDYVPDYVVPNDRAKDAISALQNAAREASSVLLATDPDREGEAIAWHLAEVLGLTNPQRITYQEITEKSVRAAVAKPRPLNMALVRAQEARRTLDRLVGYDVSPVLSKRTGNPLSAGRVQSPALRFVVERERAISAFQAVKHYGVKLTFSVPDPWFAEWDTTPFLPAGAQYLTDAAVANAVAQTRSLTVMSIEDTRTKAVPPAPFTTSTLQQSAQTTLKLKPQRTMAIAQSLYEAGLITYMRTDSPNLSDDAFADLHAFWKTPARTANCELVATKRTWKAKENAQEGHEAIRPTHFQVTSAGADTDEQALYALIWERAAASQGIEATFAVRTAELRSEEPAVDGRTPIFVARGKTLLVKGWKAIHDERDESDTQKKEDHNPVPELLQGASVAALSGAVVPTSTKAPKRYTQSSLVKELESHGIGRPATYGAILGSMISKQYIAEDEKQFLHAQSMSEQIVDSLVGTFQFVEYEYTSALELELDEIAEGRKTYVDVIRHAHDLLSTEVAQLRKSIPTYPCPSCGATMRRVTKDSTAFWGCTAYPSCKTTMPDNNGKPGPREQRAAQPATAPSAHPCPKCGAALIRKTKTKAQSKTGRGYDFYSCQAYPACDASFKVDHYGDPVFPANAA